jgi:8-oxo-dGTP diphosphatase
MTNETKTSKKPRLRTAAVISNDGKYLLTEEKIKSRNNELFWSFPGGGVEFGEPLEAALKREIMEETGIEVEINGFLDVWEKVLPEKEVHSVTVMYLAKPISGKLGTKLGEINNVSWFSKDEALKLKISDKCIKYFSKYK